MKLTPNFTREEFDCHDGTIVPAEYLPNVIEVAKNLEVLRAYLNKNIRIVSGYRTKEHNAKIKGSSPVSQHLQGKASDIIVQGISPEKVYEAIEFLISQGKMKQGGLGLYSTFVHYDIRGVKSRWDYSKKK